MNEIIFTNLQTMVDTIRAHTAEHCTYVTQADDSKRRYAGWYCLNTKTFFYITLLNIERSKSDMRRYLDTATKRKIATIYLSNCTSEAEYNNFKKKIDKLKVFW